MNLEMSKRLIIWDGGGSIFLAPTIFTHERCLLQMNLKNQGHNHRWSKLTNSSAT
jgi:hypothetical protein